MVLDGVMGGLSSGTAEVADGTMRISGTINTNGGGFVLVRRAIDAAELDGASQLRITGTTDGRTYEIIFEDGLGRDRSVSHFAPIRFDGGAPMTGEVSFADLEARTFGRTISTEAFRPDLVQTLGFIISDGVDGDFAITIERIEACA